LPINSCLQHTPREGGEKLKKERGAVWRVKKRKKKRKEKT
jgi:hypothetical protein